MTKKIIILTGSTLFLFAALALLLPDHTLKDGRMGNSFAHAASQQDKPRTAIAANAQTFLNALDSDLREKATFAFDSDERLNWHYVPKKRNGAPLNAMTEKQKIAALALLKSAMSPKGYQKATDVMKLEGILKIIENRPPDDPRRDPEKYFLSIFGTPANDKPWAWRFEGHHLSLNYLSTTPELVAVTPAFMGANPAHVLQGPYKGLRVLKIEEDLARKLVKSPNPDQLKIALIAEKAPREILTAAERSVDIGDPTGISYIKLTKEQKKLLRRLIRLYLNNHRPDLAGKMWEKVKTDRLNKLHFAWAGSLEKNLKHYYRIHGPSLLIEYDNFQNNANHIHSVLRDLNNDFGQDLLKKHYAQHPHDHK